MLNTYNHRQKSWGNLQFPERFPIHTGPTPPFTPQTILDVCIEEGEEELEKNFEKDALFYEGTEK